MSDQTRQEDKTRLVGPGIGLQDDLSNQGFQSQSRRATRLEIDAALSITVEFDDNPRERWDHFDDEATASQSRAGLGLQGYGWVKRIGWSMSFLIYLLPMIGQELLDAFF